MIKVFAQGLICQIVTKWTKKWGVYSSYVKESFIDILVVDANDYIE